jgi:hypothetical protein
VPDLAENIFNERILPVKWEKQFYIDKMKVDSEILTSCYWHTSDSTRYKSSASSPKPEIIPLGEGAYGEVTTYTDNKFVMFIITQGVK